MDQLMVKDTHTEHKMLGEFTGFYLCASLNVGVINPNTVCEPCYFNPLTEINAKGCGGSGMDGGAAALSDCAL